jgi:hypothetical protein
MATLSEMLQDAMRRAGIGAQTLSKLTHIPRTSIDNWRDGTAQRPRHWRPLLQIARVLALSQAEADAMLTTTGHSCIADLSRDIPPGHPDRKYLQPWLEALPAGSAEAYPPLWHQLRAPVTDFVGRSEAINTLMSTLRRAALHGTIAAISGVRGMGGIGKTELAYVVGTCLFDVFPDAQIVVNLRGSSATPIAPEQALRQVIHAFAPDEKLPDNQEALQARYRSLLHGRRMLILADDAHDAAQVRPLLPPPGCALLVTSRQRFTLPGMMTVDLEPLSEEEAVTLLRCSCTRLGEADACLLARACGYLPLALRASCSILHNDPALPVRMHLLRLTDERQRLMQMRDPDEAQLDVEASLALSYTQLDDAAQRVFRQLGAFEADFTTALAQAVVEVKEHTGVDVEAVLHRLLRRNLLMYDVTHGRWRLHDLMRDLARRESEAAGELEAAHWRYACAVMQIARETHDQYLAAA